MNIKEFWNIIGEIDILASEYEEEGIEKATFYLSKFSEQEILLFDAMYEYYYKLLYDKFEVEKIDRNIEAYQDLLDFIILLGEKTYKHFYHLNLDNIKSVLKYVDSLYNKIFLKGEAFNKPPYLIWYGYSNIVYLVPDAYEMATKKELTPSIKIIVPKEIEDEMEKNLQESKKDYNFLE